MKIFNILLSGFLFALCVSCTNPLATNRKSDKVKIVNQGVQIDYTDTGRGDTTLFFVHGWCINKTYWSNQVVKFNKRYRVITIDLPGFGKSGKNRKVWDTKTFSSDVNTVMSQLNLKNVILIGHSMAGDIIIQSAINDPVKVIGLVGVDNLKSVGIEHTPSKQDKADYNKAIDEMKHHFKSFAYKYVNNDLFFKTTGSEVRNRVLKDVANADSVIATACLLQDDFNEASKLIQTKKKIYLINSDVNTTDTTGFKSKNIPYKIMYVHATGHFPMIEKPEEFNLRLEQILAGI